MRCGYGNVGHPVRYVPSSQRMPSAMEARVACETRQWGIAVNRLDASLLPLLDPDAVYESQEVLNPMWGSQRIRSYVAHKFKTFASLGPELQFSVEMAHVDLDSAACHPCLIAWQGGRRNCLVVLRIGTRGVVTRINFLTTVPSPDSARRTGEFPR